MSAPDPLTGEPKPPKPAIVDTGGGAHVEGGVNTGGGTFVGRDQINYVHPPQKAILTAVQIAAYEDAYLAQVRRVCRYIHTEGIGEPTTELIGVFVMFEAMARPESRKGAPLSEAGDVVPLSERFAQMGQPDPSRPPQQEPPQPPPPPVLLSQALHDHTHLVVLGEPGTGKSTTIQYVALCLATRGWAAKLALPEGHVPVLLNLRSCDGQRALPDFLADEIARLGMFDAADSIEARRIAVTLLGIWLQEKRLVLLLDALDETAEAQRAAVLEQVARYAASHEGRDCRIVVTSRIAGYMAARRPGADFAEYIIRPFASPADALPYVRGWLQVLAPGTRPPDQVALQAKTIVDHMAQHQGLKRILGTPLLLRLAVAVHVETGRLVANRAEIYRRFVDEVLWQRTQAHHGTQFAHEDVQQALAYVAWTLHTDTNAPSVQLANGIERLTSGRISGEQMLAFLQQNLGLLAAYSYDRGPKLAFRHLTFQEFLVGRRLAERWVQDKNATWRLLRPRLHHPTWREPLLLMAGMLPAGAANDLIRRIVRAKSRYERELHRDLMLAMSVAVDCGCADGEAIRILISQALTITLNSLEYYRSRRAQSGQARRRLPSAIRWPSGIAADRQIRVPLLVQLGVLAVPALIQAVADSDFDVRRAAVEALGKIGDAAAVPALLKALSDSQIRSSAAAALYQIGDAAAVPALLKALFDSDYFVRMVAAKALGDIGAVVAVPALVQALSNSNFDSAFAARRAAAEALGHIGDAAAMPALLNALIDSHYGIRFEAAGALGKIGDAAAVPALLEALSDSSSDVRRAAAGALGGMDDAVAVSAMLKAISDADSYSDVRRVAATGLGDIGAVVAVPALVKALSDASSDVREIAAAVLGKIGCAAAVPGLIVALTDSDYFVRRAAAKALSDIGDVAAMSALHKTLSDSNFDSYSGVREVAAKALGKTGDATAVPALIQGLADSDSDVRRAAAEALGKIGDAAAVPALIQELSDSDSYVRRAAAEALGDIGDAAAVLVLVNTLSDSHYDVRRATTEALGKIGDAAAVPALLKALSDSDYFVGLGAAAALYEIDDEAAVSALLKALSDSDFHVRRTAAAAIGRIGDAAAAPALVSVLSDVNSAVRLAAAQALSKIGDAATAPALVTALSDADSYVRRAAAEALGELVAKYNEWDSANIDRIAKKLATCIYDRDGGVVTAAAEALEQSATAIAVRDTGKLAGERQLEW